MTEEIIIDGVNVAGCIQFVEDDNCCCDLGGDCKGWDDCYYKQLKRLEQERDELKQENELFRQVHKAEQDRRRKYENALEEIREIITNNNSMIIDRKVYLELQCGEPVALKLQKIYEKINEVLGC
jgi:hypothetical protein